MFTFGSHHQLRTFPGLSPGFAQQCVFASSGNFIYSVFISVLCWRLLKQLPDAPLSPSDMPGLVLLHTPGNVNTALL